MVINTARQILVCAISDIFSNFRAAARISLPWYLVIWGLPLLYVFVLLGRNNVSHAQSTPFLGVALIVMWIVLPALIAVGWHRFVLRGLETDDLFPFAGIRLSARYVGNLFILLVVCFLLLVLVWFIGEQFGLEPLGSKNTEGTKSLSLSVVAQTLSFYAFTRLGLKLPDVAIGGQSIGFVTSWTETSALRWPLALVSLALALCYVVSTDLIDMLIGPDAFEGVGRYGFLGSIPAAISFWFVTMLNISVLTVLYGHLIEERTL